MTDSTNSAAASAILDRRAFERILSFGVERGISDLHFEVGQPPHLRLQGELLPAKYPVLRPEDTDAAAQILLRDDYETFRKNKRERDVTYGIEGVSRFRASVFWQQGYVGIVLRVIPLTIRTLEQLNLPAQLETLCNMRRGLVMFTGATGNGKSTTMAALLQRINQVRRAHVITIEDPIEFLFPKEKSLVIQREIGTDTGTFREALVAALRQDPDVIMVGEIRDYETAEICLKGAETGHLILSAIHTPDATQTVQRFIGMFPVDDHSSARLRLAECLKATISLRLLARADGQGRLPAVEIMRVTRSLQDCIRSPERSDEMSEQIAKGHDLYGMQTFDQHVAELVRQEKITMDVARMAATNPEGMERMLVLE